jgi:hypothetical protein
MTFTKQEEFRQSVINNEVDNINKLLTDDVNKLNYNYCFAMRYSSQK